MEEIQQKLRQSRDELRFGFKPAREQGHDALIPVPVNVFLVSLKKELKKI